MSYDHLSIEKHWQEKWEQEKCFQCEIDPTKPKYYALDMFPYPSGAGLHAGHLASYTPTDIFSRYKRAKGFNVLHPIGYDAFGLPAEQYAIKTGVHPEETTNQCIENFRRQLKSFGFSFDWSREISTCDAKFYKWTQFIFLKLFERGLAYKKEVHINWCPELRTVLANEEIVGGVSERGGHPVVRIPMEQWVLKITEYAERLLQDLDKLDWPEKTKEGQRNWIGKSVGANIQFQIKDNKEMVEVFTTRPDTLFGCTFLVLAPEHPLVENIVTPKNKEAIKKYVGETQKKSEISRKSYEEKTGVFTGAYATHPFTKKDLPIWIADYVLMDYGTGSIMSVPAHDERDFGFAKEFGIDITPVIESDTELPFEGDGAHINSEFLNGLNNQDAKNKMAEELEKNKCGTTKVQYKLRDWLFSRQRYWGEPFPIFKNDQGELHSVAEDELPVLLPSVADYEPTEKGEPPLARVEEFLKYQDGQRETDTMPGSAGSSWYFLRYTDPQNDKEAFNFEAQKYWMPVDLYIGGSEHTVGHLLYSRFWQKVLFDCELVSHDEPFQKLAHQGVIMGPDGHRMSKSRGNTINPDDIRQEYGSDAARVYVSFLGPFDKDKPWDTNGIEGVRRFLQRIHRLILNDEQNLHATEDELSETVNKALHKCIKSVSEDIENLAFNTAVSAMMIFVNTLYKENVHSTKALKPLVQLLAPFAPHLCEEWWHKMGETSLVSIAPWPEYDDALTKENEVTLGVQVNGKMRGTIEIAVDAEEVEAVSLAREVTAVANALGDSDPFKIIYKPGKILNLIVK